MTPNRALSTLRANGSDVESIIYTITNTGQSAATLGTANLVITPSSGLNITPQLQTGITDECTQGTTLTQNQSCYLEVVYGPASTDINTAENGTYNLSLTYNTSNRVCHKFCAQV